jgi:uncharacterized OsmC-like protein
MADELAAGVNGLIGIFSSSPDKAKATFGVSTELEEGLRAPVRARQHVLVIDEPSALGGTDTGANPVEAVLAGLASCQAITYRVWAAKLGVALDTVSVEADGDIDLLGFFGIDPDARAGYNDIRLRVTLDGPESPERYRELADAVDAHCPVLDIIENSVPVTRTLVEPAAVTA